MLIENHSCIKEVKALCSKLRNADAEVAELVLRLDNSLLRFAQQINFLNRIRDIMDEDHREIHVRTLNVLLGKLQSVVTILRGLSKQTHDENSLTTKKIQYAWKKDSLDKAIEEVVLWQTTADQSYFLIMRMADHAVDNALSEYDSDDDSSTAVSIRSAIRIRAGLQEEPLSSTNKRPGTGLTLPSTALESMEITAIPYCDGMLIARRAFSDRSTTTYILNRIRCLVTSREEALKRNVRDLVRKLQHDEPHTFGLLQCKGCILPSSRAPEEITLVFRQPKGTSHPTSLRHILLDPPTISLSQRIGIAKDIAKSVGYVHTFGFVHKNVRPESFIVFQSSNGLSGFLAGFEEFRQEEGWTLRRGDDAPTKNIYHHASRQGSNPQEDFVMQHDIYSLGVCLLEIGLWGSFVDYASVQASPTLATLLEMPSSVAAPQASAFLMQSGKEHLLSLAQSQLPARMGDQFTAIVRTCLTCLDVDNENFGDAAEFLDEDGIRVGARYIEKVSLG